MTAIDLPAQVSRTIREQNLFATGDTIIVALSGGADSCALLDILAGLRELSPRLVVAHLNHCLRGAESDADERFCQALAGRYSLPFHSRRCDVAALARTRGLGLEDAGRRARMAFLDQLRTSRGGAAIALAHHADDQAETVLMRLLRGSGATGLAGMRFKTDDGRIRPLLSSSRSDILAHLSARGLPYREDASNRDTAFLRNRIRHELLPLLASYNPAIAERLVATAAILSGEDDLLERQTGALLEQACQVWPGSIACSLPRLEGEHPALLRRLFRRILAQLAGDGDHFCQRHIQALEQLARSPRPNASLNLPRRILALREYDRLLFRTPPPPEAAELGELSIPGPGRYGLPDGSLLLLQQVTQCEAASPCASAPLLDLDRAPFPWLLRGFRGGDRLRPSGMEGSKKVKELFMERRIPPAERGKIPLLFCNGELIWVCGIRTSRMAAADGASKNMIRAIYSRNRGEDFSPENDPEEGGCHAYGNDRSGTDGGRHGAPSAEKRP